MQKVMKKRKLKKFPKPKKLKFKKNIKFLLLSLIAILLVVYMFFTIPPILKDRKLVKLGYSKPAVEIINQMELDERLLEEKLFSANLNTNIILPSFMPEYLELYLATDSISADDFRLYGKLVNLDYKPADIIKMFTDLEFWEMTPLLVFGHVDVTEYMEDVITNRVYNSTTVFQTTNDYTSYYEPVLPVENPNSIDKLVNKTYYLDKNFVPENLVELSIQYSAQGLQLTQVAADALVTMCNEAEKEDIHMYASSTYRDYEHQANIHESYTNKKDLEYADSLAGRPGHSEHQSGLTIDMASTENGGLKKFAESGEYPWMLANAHKYGFILRYPPGKQAITGYIQEEWHWRYVGVDLATNVKNSNLTFDEYYMLYID